MSFKGQIINTLGSWAEWIVDLVLGLSGLLIERGKGGYLVSCSFLMLNN